MQIISEEEEEISEISNFYIEYAISIQNLVENTLLIEFI